MGESAKAVLSLLVVIGVFGSWAAWTMAPKDLSHHEWELRVGFFLMGALSLSALLWAQFRWDKIPDRLKQIARDRLDCGGLAFVVVAENVNGICALTFYIQNRYEKPCETRLLIRPAVKNLGILRPGDLASFEKTIECPGGAFGSSAVPYAVPLRHQGKVVRFNVGGATEYPRGRGKLLLFTEGVRVRPAVGLADKLVTALSVVALEPHFSHDAGFDLRFPTDVAETLPESINSATSGTTPESPDTRSQRQ
jgi:hypothetical protein